MIAYRRKVLLLGGVAAAVLALVAGAKPTDQSGRSREAARLRAHFDSVIVELRSANVAHLTEAQRSARAMLVGRLAEYAAVARFPHNHVLDEKRVPVFQDDHGTLCAMAFLIESTGRSDIVRAVKRANNLGYIPELAADQRLAKWLDSTGLTVAEAARVQPAYGGCRMLGDCPAPPELSAEPSREFRAGSTIASVITGTSILVNGLAPSRSLERVRLQSSFGVIAGIAQIALGSHGMIQGSGYRPWGYVNLGLGATALATAVWRFRQPPPTPSVASRVSVTPLVSFNGGTAGIVVSGRM